MWPISRPSQWVGRTQELEILRAAAKSLRGGEGAAVWVEGEPGIGKSSLVAEALASASDPAWEIGWGMADQLTERLPLRVMLDCLQVRPGSPDPRRAHAADLLRSRRPGLFADGDLSVTGVEVLVALVDELCAAAPTVIVVDDLQWADEASLVVWHHLAASIGQLRLLLIGTCRPTPRRKEVQQVRAAAVRRGGAVITLGPLPETDVTALVTAMVGAPPGDALRQLTAQAAGNPLYVRELVDALVREQALQIRPVAEVAMAGEQLPVSLAAVLTDRLSSVSAGTAQVLRIAALLGGRFTVTDLAVVLRRPVSDLAAALQEAAAAGILAGSGSELVFRHPLIRQALYESMPGALSTALHAEAAQDLATAGADALSVAQQLSAANRPGEGWARAWLIEAAPALATRAPQLAAELLRRELEETPADEEARDALMAGLVRALLAVGSYEEAARQASRALTMMTDPARRGQTSWMLARAQVSAGDNDDAITTIRQALAPADLPGEWRARMLALLAMLERVGAGDLDAADATARQALAVAEKAGDAFATAHALADLWLTHGVRRDHAAALDYLDRALRVLGDDPGRADLRSYALDGRVFTLQNLDRWPDAELALRQAREFAQRTGRPDSATWVTAAVLQYWLGQWDDALAELGFDDAGADAYLRERWPALLSHGVAALATGDRQIAQAAARACQAEASAETRPARAAAASLRCHGLLEFDPDPLRDAVAHYRAVGPPVELPAALEDLAVVLADRGREEEARAALNEAASLYDGLQARWDIRRAEGRIRPYGIRRGARGRRGQRAASGWEALTPTEIKIAALVARGDSTPDIARGMFLSRRTVQTYISRILAKLGAKGRVEIVREALRHGVSP